MLGASSRRRRLVTSGTDEHLIQVPTRFVSHTSPIVVIPREDRTEAKDDQSKPLHLHSEFE